MKFKEICFLGFFLTQYKEMLINIFHPNTIYPPDGVYIDHGEKLCRIPVIKSNLLDNESSLGGYCVGLFFFVCFFLLHLM